MRVVIPEYGRALNLEGLTEDWLVEIIKHYIDHILLVTIVGTWHLLDAMFCRAIDFIEPERIRIKDYLVLFYDGVKHVFPVFVDEEHGQVADIANLVSSAAVFILTA